MSKSKQESNNKCCNTEILAMLGSGSQECAESICHASKSANKNVFTLSTGGWVVSLNPDNVVVICSCEIKKKGRRGGMLTLTSQIPNLPIMGYGIMIFDHNYLGKICKITLILCKMFSENFCNCIVSALYLN